MIIRVMLLSNKPMVPATTPENRFRIAHLWMIYLHLISGSVVIMMFLWQGNPIDPARGGITSIVHFGMSFLLILIQLYIRRFDRLHGSQPLPVWVAPAGVAVCYVSVFQGLAFWGMSESLGLIIVPVMAVYTRLALDRRRAFILTAAFLSVCLGIYALLHFGVIPWAWAYYVTLKPPPPRPAMFTLEMVIVFGLTAFMYYFVDRLSEVVMQESGRARGLYETARAFFDASPDGILVLDPNGLVVESNAMGERLLNTNPGSGLNGEILLRFIHPGYHGVVWDGLLHTPRAMSRFERVEAITDSGHTVALETRIVAFDGETPGHPRFLMTIRDRRDEEKLRNQLQKAQRLDSLGALAGGVAHDLNNALNPILGFASLEMQTPGLPEETRQSLQLIRDCALRATGLSKQLLALSRGGAPEVRWIDATEIAANIVSVIDRATPPGIEVSFDAPERHIEVEFSAAQLEQVLLNLLTNAIEAIGDKGLLRFELSLLEGDRMKEELIGWESETAMLIEVTDSGCGIPEEHLKQIFDPFFTTKESRRGTGLGLSVVERIVGDGRGLVRVESKPGVGSVFRVYLPNARYAEKREVQPEARRTAVRGRHMSILAVDDEPSNLVLIQKIAERMGDRVRTANSCAEARAFAMTSGEKFDLVLMDLLLPDGNGGDLYEELKARLGNPRVIFLSGYSRESIPKHVLDSKEFEAFFPKPINVAQLTESIEDCRARV